jgi:hypothetical protein
MKTIEVPAGAAEVNNLLDQAGREDIVVRTADGREFMVMAIDEFDFEVARTRRNKKLMALLDARAKTAERIPFDEVKRQLGMSKKTKGRKGT